MSSNSGGARRRARARIFRALVVAVGTALVPAPASAETSAETGAEVPRIILGLYDGGNGGQLEFSLLHKMAEMPLNHLGLIVRYHDIQDGLPPVPSSRPDGR